jgi:hypothetical protein
MTVQLHRVLNSPHKGNTSKTLGVIKEKPLLWENVECSHTIKHIQNPWNTGLPLHTLSILRWWKWRLKFALYTTNNVVNCLPSLLKFFFNL